ncbi:MAG: hypothetical protein IJW19_05545 [Clostridia bacterium]|nr:hypothetical protein [Clostridia bacterium]
MCDSSCLYFFISGRFHFSEYDTREFSDKCNRRDTDNSNVLIKTVNAVSRSDDRPIFIYDYLDRLDEAIDITPVLNRLSSLGRQIFISVCDGYPCEKIKNKRVQIVHMEDNNGKN